MKLFFLFVSLAALAMVASCGLESVQTLNKPEATYSDSQLVTDTQLSFIHRDSRYSGSPFVGYQVYYKVYPVSLTADFARLLADRSSLSATPTVNQLVSLGYQSFTHSSSSDGNSTGLENLLIVSPPEGTAVSLDFSDALRAAGGPPVLKIGASLPSKPYLYRAMELAGTDRQTFASLRRATQKDVDMSSLMTASELTRREFEINVFVVAYGMTATLSELYSEPVPWGVIRTFKP